jgi:hypothetical protein
VSDKESGPSEVLPSAWAKAEMKVEPQRRTAEIGYAAAYTAPEGKVTSHPKSGMLRTSTPKLKRN